MAYALFPLNTYVGMEFWGHITPFLAFRGFVKLFSKVAGFDLLPNLSYIFFQKRVWINLVWIPGFGTLFPLCL
jgi:hypothetical protein